MCVCVMGSRCALLGDHACFYPEMALRRTICEALYHVMEGEKSQKESKAGLGEMGKARPS